jgi:zinc transport system ATP-binding protein
MLVLDDPVAGLDKRSVADIYELIYNLNRREGITVVTVTEDISAALKYGTKILRINKDSIFLGSPEEFAALIGVNFI